jgi:hypothetical protein
MKGSEIVKKNNEKKDETFLYIRVNPLLCKKQIFFDAIFKPKSKVIKSTLFLFQKENRYNISFKSWSILEHTNEFNVSQLG